MAKFLTNTSIATCWLNFKMGEQVWAKSHTLAVVLVTQVAKSCTSCLSCMREWAESSSRFIRERGRKLIRPLDLTDLLSAPCNSYKEKAVSFKDRWRLSKHEHCNMNSCWIWHMHIYIVFCPPNFSCHVFLNCFLLLQIVVVLFVPPDKDKKHWSMPFCVFRKKKKQKHENKLALWCNPIVEKI